MKFPHTKHGLACDPRGAHVKLEYQDRTLIGEVIGCHYDTIRGAVLLHVRHFNGEPWLIEPGSWSVDVLCRHEHVNRWTIGDENGTEEQAQCADCGEVLP